jgi:hypothetical protein
MNTLTTLLAVALLVAASAWASTAIIFLGDRDAFPQKQGATSAMKFDPVFVDPGSVIAVR